MATRKKPQAAAKKAVFTPIFTDPKTGLEWGPTLEGLTTWKQYLKAAEPYNDGGTDDCRPATIEEQITLIDFLKSRPAAKDGIAHDMKLGFYWSSTPLTSSPGVYAWGVIFNSGYVHYNYQYSKAFARLVRGPRAGQ